MLRTESDENLFIIEAAVSEVATEIQIPEAEDKVQSLNRDYLIELRISGYRDLITWKPHIAIEILWKGSSPNI